jgi:hypothetical protein
MQDKYEVVHHLDEVKQDLYVEVMQDLILILHHLALASAMLLPLHATSVRRRQQQLL